MNRINFSRIRVIYGVVPCQIQGVLRMSKRRSVFVAFGSANTEFNVVILNEI